MLLAESEDEVDEGLKIFLRTFINPQLSKGVWLKENTHSVILSTLLKDISESEIKPETDICAAAGKFFFHTITKLSPFYWKKRNFCKIVKWQTNVKNDIKNDFRHLPNFSDFLGSKTTSFVVSDINWSHWVWQRARMFSHAKFTKPFTSSAKTTDVQRFRFVCATFVLVDPVWPCDSIR